MQRGNYFKGAFRLESLLLLDWIRWVRKKMPSTDRHLSNDLLSFPKVYPTYLLFFQASVWNLICHFCFLLFCVSFARSGRGRGKLMLFTNPTTLSQYFY